MGSRIHVLLVALWISGAAILECRGDEQVGTAAQAVAAPHESVGMTAGPPVSVSYPDLGPCPCAECTIDYRGAGPVFGERLLLSCSERFHRTKAHCNRLWHRLTHQTYYPPCPPLCDPAYGYRATCWRQLPDCGFCPPAAVVVVSPGTWSQEAQPFLPPTPASPADPAIEPPVPGAAGDLPAPGPGR